MSLDIECERFFDGESLHGRTRVTVEGERITAVASSAEGAAASGTTDAEQLRCKFLMPGLIDSHLHIAGYVEGSPAGVPFQPMKNFMRLLVLNGITTVRDTGNSIETILYMREWGERFIGPRVFSSGPLLDVPPMVWPFSRIVRDPESARRQVEMLHLEGMDFIKSYRNVPAEVLVAIVETARSFGMDVAADVRALPAIDAARCGVRSLEHAMNLLDESLFPEIPSIAEAKDGDFSGADGRARFWSHVDLEAPIVDELIAVLKEHGTFVCPTLLVTHRWCSLDDMVQEPYLDYMVGVMPYHSYFKRMQGTFGKMIGRHYLDKYMPMPSPSRKEKDVIDRGLANIREITKRLHEAGVRIVVGTDSPNPSIVPGFSLHQEMSLLVASGLPAEAVLTYATSAAADLLRKDELGRIKPGALADLLLLDGDPTEDITHTMQVQDLIKGGVKVDRSKVLEKFKATLER